MPSVADGYFHPVDQEGNVLETDIVSMPLVAGECFRGSGDLCHLTWEDWQACERLRVVPLRGERIDVSMSGRHSLACVRALPGARVSTWPLALS